MKYEQINENRLDVYAVEFNNSSNVMHSFFLFASQFSSNQMQRNEIIMIQPFEWLAMKYRNQSLNEYHPQQLSDFIRNLQLFETAEYPQA